jgi:hypothetical protein
VVAGLTSAKKAAYDDAMQKRLTILAIEIRRITGPALV